MNKKAAEQTWEEYYAVIHERRTNEARAVLSQMRAAGLPESATLALDFGFFSSEKADADELIAQLSENYQMSVVHDVDDYWHVRGTTRPYGIELSSQVGLEWVAFMLDVARSYRCVFAFFKLEHPESGQSWSTENIEPC